MKKLEDYSKEELPHVVHEMITKHDTGFISVKRKDRTRSENNETELKISTYLRHKGYSLVKAKGSLGRDSDTSAAAGVVKESFFVVDINDTGRLEKDLTDLRIMADQNAIVFIGKGAGQDVLIGDSKCDLFSKIREGEIVFEPFESAHTYFGKMGHHLLAKKVEEEIETIKSKG